MRSRRMRRGRKRPNSMALGRAVRYVGRYPRVMGIALLSLFVATAAQLAVPQLVQNIIDTIITNATNQTILNLPEQFQTVAANRLGLDLSTMAIDLENAPRAIVMAGLNVVPEYRF